MPTTSPSSSRPPPRAGGFDSTLALLADPYGFIGRHCRALGAEVFETRLLLQRTVCMTGAEAAALFYDGERFQREGAAPEPLRATLFGKGGVQGLDGLAHRRRKALFMEIVTPPAVDALATRVADEWRAAASRWRPGTTLALYAAAQHVLARAVCDWADVPVSDDDLPLRCRQLASLFDDAARGPLRHLRARGARRSVERWIADEIAQVRDGRRTARAGSALDLVARHRDASGEPLAGHVAAVELVNVLRPTIASSVYVVFAAHALEMNGRCRDALAGGDWLALERFLMEVRRHYPFFPAVVARTRRDVEWKGWRIPRGRRVMLDLYGTNHDPRVWEAPDRFDPDRFRERVPGPFEFVPQGGGEAARHHRCPGEGVVTAVVAATIDFLLHDLAYEPAVQDMTVDHHRLPALLRSHFAIRVLGRGVEAPRRRAA